MSERVTAQPAPPRMTLRGVHTYLNAIEAPRAANRRLVFLIVLLGTAVLAQALGFMMLLPLKERVPYPIKIDMDSRGQPTGSVTVVDQPMMSWTPAEANIRYFLARWAENLVSVDERSKDTRLPASFAMLKGQAMGDWQTYVQTQGKPLEKLSADPATREMAEVISISFLSEGSAMIRVKITDRRGASRRVQINLNYALIPPSSDEEVYRSPIGLWIVSFGVVNELA